MDGHLILLCTDHAVDAAGGDAAEHIAEHGAEDSVTAALLPMLREVVRRTQGGVLVRTGPVHIGVPLSGSVLPDGPGPVLIVQPRRAGDPVGPITAEAVWLGPLRREHLPVVRAWLTAGGPGVAPLPAPLHRVRRRPVSLPAPALN